MVVLTGWMNEERRCQRDWSETELLRQTHSAALLIVSKHLAPSESFCRTTHLRSAQNSGSQDLQRVPCYLMSAPSMCPPWKWLNTQTQFMTYLWWSDTSLDLLPHPSLWTSGRPLLLPRGGRQQMPLNQFGQRPRTTSGVINGDVWSVDTRSVQLTS